MCVLANVTNGLFTVWWVSFLSHLLIPDDLHATLRQRTPSSGLSLNVKTSHCDHTFPGFFMLLLNIYLMIPFVLCVSAGKESSAAGSHGRHL